jgi:hypothetical protein
MEYRMTQAERIQYELARKEGDRRFGSNCKHPKPKNGRCPACCRKIVS